MTPGACAWRGASWSSPYSVLIGAALSFLLAHAPGQPSSAAAPAPLPSAGRARGGAWRQPDDLVSGRMPSLEWKVCGTDGEQREDARVEKRGGQLGVSTPTKTRRKMASSLLPRSLAARQAGWSSRSAAAHTHVRAHPWAEGRAVLSSASAAGSLRAGASRETSSASSSSPGRLQAARLTAAHAAAESAEAAPASTPAVRLPISPGDQADQAAAAVLAAHAAGHTRQRVDFLLPIIGATDLDDWPGGIRMQAKAAMPMVERLLAAIRRGAPALGGRLESSVLDDGDAVCLWQNPSLACILFPTAETLADCVSTAEARDKVGGLTLIISPQWNDGPGQLVPDFGFFGRAKKSAAAASFQLAYSLSQMRVSGDDTRLQFSVLSETDGDGEQASTSGKDTGGAWTVWYTPDGSRNAAVPLTRSTARPTYREVEAVLVKTPGTAAGLPPFERARREAAFIQRTMKDNVRSDE